MGEEFKNNEIVENIFRKIKSKITRLDLDYTDDEIYDEIISA